MIVDDKHAGSHSTIVSLAATGNLLDFPDLARISGKDLTTPHR
jgi:hypothetical protein